MPSRRCETERSLRVSRSMSAAEGMFRAPIATSCAWAAFSRASNARPIAPVSRGFSSRSDSALPSRSSVEPLKRSRRFLATLLASDIRCSRWSFSRGPWRTRAAAQSTAPRGRIRCSHARAAVPLHPDGVSLGARAARRAISVARTAEREAGARRRSRHARRPPLGGRTLRARRRRRMFNRPAARTPATPEPATVATARATIVDPVSVSAERQAQAWLRDLDPERDVGAALAVLNRLLHTHRIASADPYIHEVSPAQALVIRAGWGEGEQVAYGRWLHARELPVPATSRPRRARQAASGRRTSHGRAAPGRAPRRDARRAAHAAVVRGPDAARATRPRPGSVLPRSRSSWIARSPRRCPSCAPRGARI